jgi:hypothetical protein
MEMSALLHSLANEINIVSISIEIAKRSGHLDADEYILRHLSKAGAACERCQALIGTIKRADGSLGGELVDIRPSHGDMAR